MFYCHVQPGVPSKAREKRCDAIIREIDPGAEGVVSAQGKTWVSLRPLGHPFDNRNAAEVRRRLEEAGLWPIVPRGRP